MKMTMLMRILWLEIIKITLSQFNAKWFRSITSTVGIEIEKNIALTFSVNFATHDLLSSGFTVAFVGMRRDDNPCSPSHHRSEVSYLQVYGHTKALLVLYQNERFKCRT
jgi:hypothetical protein